MRTTGASGGPFLPQAADAMAAKTNSHRRREDFLFTTKGANNTKSKEILLRVLRGDGLCGYSLTACSTAAVSSGASACRVERRLLSDGLKRRASTPRLRTL